MGNPDTAGASLCAIPCLGSDARVCGCRSGAKATNADRVPSTEITGSHTLSLVVVSGTLILEGRSLVSQSCPETVHFAEEFLFRTFVIDIEHLENLATTQDFHILDGDRALGDL